jgi:hypothetical protein
MVLGTGDLLGGHRANDQDRIDRLPRPLLRVFETGRYQSIISATGAVQVFIFSRSGT